MADKHKLTYCPYGDWDGFHYEVDCETCGFNINICLDEQVEDNNVLWERLAGFHHG